MAPKRFIQRLRKDNELFRSHMHQDAHEFLNFVLNCCCDLLEQEARLVSVNATPHTPALTRAGCRRSAPRRGRAQRRLVADKGPPCVHGCTSCLRAR